MEKPLLKRVTGDLSGGFVTAIISLPGNIAFGLIAFSPLGPEYHAHGILAGMLCSIIAGIFASLFGGSPGVITGPKAPLALILSTVMIQLTVHLKLSIKNPGDISTLLVYVFFIVSLAGVIQILFSVLHAERLLTFIPYTVIAGFLNGTAILIILDQIWEFLGVPISSSVFDIFKSFHLVKPTTVFISCFTIVLILVSTKFIKKINGLILGLVFGTGLYYLMWKLGYIDQLNPTIGHIPSGIPSLKYLFGFKDIIKGSEIGSIMPLLLSAGFSIAILSSIDSLMASQVMKNHFKSRFNIRKEIFGQGIGNLISGGFGGIAGAGYVSRSTVNYTAGGRTRISSVVHSLTIFLFILFLPKGIGMIPRPVMAGIIIVVAFQIFDKWSLRLVYQFFKLKGKLKKKLAVSLLIIIFVTCTAVVFNIITAVVLGIFVSIILFILQMSKSIIRKTYNGSTYRSKLRWSMGNLRTLNTHGNKIIIFELEGTLFFGAADFLENEVEKKFDEGAEYIILDMKRIKDMDVTAIKIVTGLIISADNKNVKVILANFDASHPVFHLFMQEATRINEQVLIFFNDKDIALEYCERGLINKYGKIAKQNVELTLKQMELFTGLKTQELKIVEKFLIKKVFKQGAKIFKQRQKGQNCYLIVNGIADIIIDIPGKDRFKRVQTLFPGAFFGEMALLESKPRSASVIAKEELVCWCLSLKNFNSLVKKSPNIAIMLLSNLTRTLSSRLRETNKLVSELSE